jgi:hypothetical protein
MTKAAKSVYYFGFYLLGLSMLLVFVPNTLLKLFMLEPTEEVWIKVLGAVVFLLGIYYVRTAPTNNEVFIKTTVLNRLLILGWFLLFVILGWGSPFLLLFAGVDVLGAAWTWYELRKGKG